jgi:Heterokaryon incompatibility protein (HET)
MSYFLHSPLADPESEIRLVILQPGKKYESVHCDLITVPSISAKPFEALSYCWGRTNVTNTIFVHGKSLRISPNLEQALRHLRMRNSQRSLWIDAICINQTDIPEKNKQVPKMRQIYKHASEVLVWIGRDHEPEDTNLTWNPAIWGDEFTIPGKGTSETTQQAFEFANTLAKMFQLHPFERNFDGLFLPILKTRDNYVTLSRLLKREWFRRLWTIQEVVLAKKCKVICGYQSLPWKTLEEATQGITFRVDQFDALNCFYYTGLGHDNIRRITQCRLNRSILPILQNTQASTFFYQGVQYSDARDRLFGLMGMVDGGEDIKPDYTQDYKEVYRSWVVRHIVRTQSLDVLSLCADETQHNFPSWVPDLTQPSGCDNPLFYIMHAIRDSSHLTLKAHLYNASGNANTRARFTETPDPSSAGSLIRVLRPTLCVKAIHIEKIIGITPELADSIYDMDPQLLADLQQKMKEIEDRVIAVQYLRPNPVSLSKIYEEFGTTLFRGNSHPLDSISPAERYERWRGRAGAFDILPGSREEILFKVFYKLLQNHLLKAQIFFTESGIFGLVSANCHIRDGDDVYILEGGKTPFILREEGLGKHRLMGPCYLYGAMAGERVLNGWDVEPSDSRWGYGLGKMRDINII